MSAPPVCTNSNLENLRMYSLKFVKEWTVFNLELMIKMVHQGQYRHPRYDQNCSLKLGVSNYVLIAYMPTI